MYRATCITSYLIRLFVTECNSPAKSSMPWLCMDLTYISALLHEGFGLTKETKMQVR